MGTLSGRFRSLIGHSPILGIFARAWIGILQEIVPVLDCANGDKGRKGHLALAQMIADHAIFQFTLEGRCNIVVLTCHVPKSVEVITGLEWCLGSFTVLKVLAFLDA